MKKFGFASSWRSKAGCYGCLLFFSKNFYSCVLTYQIKFYPVRQKQHPSNGGFVISCRSNGENNAPETHPCTCGRA